MLGISVTNPAVCDSLSVFQPQMASGSLGSFGGWHAVFSGSQKRV